MGRRPNAIVGDYFIRGQKLEDASNRYEHDCKKCGEHVSCFGDVGAGYWLVAILIRNVVR